MTKLFHRQSFQYVMTKVDELYSKQFNENDIESINSHCEFIQSFIECSGWTIEEFIIAMMMAPKLNKINRDNSIKNIQSN